MSGFVGDEYEKMSASSGGVGEAFDGFGVIVAVTFDRSRWAFCGSFLRKAMSVEA